jgi:hypothetical protein
VNIAGRIPVQNQAINFCGTCLCRQAGGFLDKDTNQLVCNDCRKTHYQAKSKTEYKGLYTEFPVIILE